MAFAYYTDYTVTAGQVPSSQADYPFLIADTDARYKVVGSGGHVESAIGSDLIPHVGGGLSTRRDFELVSYNSATGQFEMYCRDASIADGNVTRVGYGDAGITTDQSNPTDVWGANFLAVWHFGDGTTLSLLDSTSNNNDGTNNGAVAIAGQNGGAVETDASSPHYVMVTDAASQRPATSVTMSAWVFPDATGNYPNIISHASGNPYYGYEMFLWGGGGTTNKIGAYCAYNANAVTYQGTGQAPDDTWSLIAVCYDGAEIMSWLNGAPDGSTAATGALTYTVTQDLRIGRQSLLGSGGFTGNIDELRLSDMMPSDDWNETDFNNQSAPLTFLTRGSEVAVGAGTTAPRPLVNAGLVNRGLVNAGLVN